MAILYPPLSFEAFFDVDLYPFDFFEHPLPIADTTGTLVGSAPYFATANDGNYHEGTEEFFDGQYSGLVFTGEWTPSGSPVDIAVDWRVYFNAEDGGSIDIDFGCDGVVDGLTFANFITPGWHSGTSYLSELPFIDAPAVAAAFFNSGAETQPRVLIASYPADDGSPSTGATYRVDLIRVSVITDGPIAVPLRLMQRGDGLGMGSGRILGTGTRQSSTRLFGSL